MSVYQDRLFQACFPIISTVCLELAATNSSHQRLSLSLSVFKSTLKFYSLRLSFIDEERAASATEVTNVCAIKIRLLLLCHVKSASHFAKELLQLRDCRPRSQP